MATPDWEAIESAYRAGVLSLRDIGDKYGVTEGAIRKRAKKFDWVRKAVRRYAKMVRKVVRKRVRRVPAKSLPALAVRKKYATKSRTSTRYETDTRVRTDPPNPFQPGNQQALKHGGYARRLLLKDEVIEDAKALTLEDELFRLRANNLSLQRILAGG
jgi:uncharacterized protein YjcR